MFLAFEADILRSGVRRLEKLANILPNNNHLLSTPAPTGSSIFEMLFFFPILHGKLNYAYSLIILYVPKYLGKKEINTS